MAVFSETLRRHLTSAGYIVFLILVATAGIFVSTFKTPGSLWPSLVTLLSAITGAGLIGPEFSTGTLQLIVSKPIRRSVYLISRVTGVFASVALAAVVGLTAECIPRLFLATQRMPWQRLADAFIGSLAASLLAIALLTLLGSLTHAYFNVAIYIGTQVVLSTTQALMGVVRVRGRGVGAFLEQHPEVERGLAAIEDILFAPAPADVSGGWLLRVVATAVIAVALACLIFERREVPYGSD